MSTINPNDANIAYSPYTWAVASGSAKTICAGAYLRTTFAATALTTLSLSFDMTNQPASPNGSRIAARVDGGPWQEFTVAATVALTIPSGRAWSVHTVEMVVLATTETVNRWNAPQETAVVLTGITGDVALTTQLTRKRPLRGLAVGDSITEGVRVLNATATGDVNRNDSRLSWAYPLGELLGAEMGVVGFGGVGITDPGNGNVPKIATSLPSLFSGQTRDMTAKPDFVVFNVGTNDTPQTDADVTADTITMLNWAISNTDTTAPIVVMAGWLQRKASAIIAGIAGCSAPSRVTYVDTTGWWSTADASDALHPYGYINTSDLAPRVASTVKGLMVTASTTPAFFINIGGVATPVY